MIIMKKRILCIIIPVILTLTFFGILIKKNSDLKRQPIYCQELYKELNNTSVQYKCSEIKTNDTEESIRFIFNLRDLDEYDRKSCTDDIIRIRNQISAYLSNHPQNDLVKKQISLQFLTLPGDAFEISNFSQQKEGLYNDFHFCSDITIPINQYNYFINAISISIKVEKTDDLILLERFNRLEYLYLIGPELSDEEKEYIVKLLDNCVIVYNGVKL